MTFKHLLIIAGILCSTIQSNAQKTTLKPSIGVATSLENDSIVTASGYACIIESVGKRIAPKNVSDEDFQKKVLIFKQLKTPVCAFNLFIPGELKVVGPAVDEKAVLEYVETVLSRISRTDTRMVVWGSGGSRRVPDGFDRKTAEKQFVAIAKKIARIAEKYQIVIALENLNSTETNFINTVGESLRIVKKVHHPNLRINTDIYHMLKENEPPAMIYKARKYLVHAEIAEKNGRTPPGVAGEDFRPYLRELKKAGYQGNIVIEGQWADFPKMAAPALQFLQNQIDEVYGK